LRRLLSLLGFSAFFIVRSFEAMLVAMALLAFFWSAALPLVETVTFDHLRDEPGRYSRIRLWGSIGFIVAVMGTGALLDHLPLSSAAVGDRRHAGRHSGLRAGGSRGGVAWIGRRSAVPVATILRQARVRALFAACFLMSAAHGALYVFYSIHLADHHYSKFLVGCLWSLGVLAEIGSSFSWRPCCAALACGTILLLSFAAAVLRFLMIGWGVEWLSVIVLAQLLHGLTFGAYHAAAIAAVNRWFPGRCQARGQALYSSISFGAGGLLGSLLSGWTWERLGRRADLYLEFGVCCRRPVLRVVLGETERSRRGRRETSGEIIGGGVRVPGDLARFGNRLARTTDSRSTVRGAGR
jgi:PPP family 3-phenylpropionic acid transporter